MRAPLHQLIEENAQQIVDQFIAVARAYPLPPRALTQEPVAGHLRRYLLEMVAVMKAGEGDRIRSEAAKEHAEQRWYFGYDMKSVILEYALLRKVVLEFANRAGEPLTLEESEPLGQFINEALAQAAVDFMKISLSQVTEALRREERNKEARDEVLATVSHDLKTPLSIIHGSAAMLARQLDTEDFGAKRPNFSKGVERIKRASLTMNTLVSNLLDVEHLRE